MSPTITTLVLYDVPPVPNSTEKILTIILPVMLGLVVLVLITLGIYSCMRRCCRQTTAVPESVAYTLTAVRGSLCQHYTDDVCASLSKLNVSCDLQTTYRLRFQHDIQYRWRHWLSNPRTMHTATFFTPSFFFF